MNPLDRILYFCHRILSGMRFRISRRVTRAGLAVLGGFFIVSMTGLDTDNTVAYQAFALLLFLLLVSVPFLFFFKVRFSAARSLPRFGTAGVPLSYRVKITNHTDKTQRGLMLQENVERTRLSYREWRAGELADRKRYGSFRLSRPPTQPAKAAIARETPMPPIPPHRAAEATVDLTPLRRGILRFGGVMLTRSDPLGLVRSFQKFSLPQSLLVLPKRYPLPPIALPGLMKYQQGGVAFASNVGQSEEFVALRDYRHGDPVRHVHWRSWAKAGKPIVKEFQDEFFVRHALILDTFTDEPQSELFEEAVSVAASFACTVLTQESLLDLLFVGPNAYCFTAGRGLAHSDQILEILASVRACDDKKFDALQNLVLGHASKLSGCICVLLAWDELRHSLVRKLQTIGVPVLVVVLSEQGRAKSLDPGPLRDNPERFHVLELGAIEQGLARLRS